MTLREFIIKESCDHKCCAKDFDDEELEKDELEGKKSEKDDSEDDSDKKKKKKSKKHDDEEDEDVCPECGKKFSECKCC